MISKNCLQKIGASKKKRDPFGPSYVLIAKDGLYHMRTVQLPFQEVTEQLMGVTGQTVMYDVRELLRDIDRLKQQVIEIVDCCSCPIDPSHGVAT